MSVSSGVNCGEVIRFSKEEKDFLEDIMAGAKKALGSILNNEEVVESIIKKLEAHKPRY